MPSNHRDERISGIFYYFREHTSIESGRTVGRKIGVVQEIILRKYLEASSSLRRRMFLEQTLTGRSGATHKVEFSWFALETVLVEPGDLILGTPDLKLHSLAEDGESVRVSGSGVAGRVNSEGVPRTGRLRALVNDHRLELRLVEVRAGRATIDVVNKNKLLASLESKRVGAQRFSGSSQLGSGIQTIEKAKQTSMVAIDLDLAYNGTVKPLQDDVGKAVLSFVALGNGVHWTDKDLALLDTYVDFTYLVEDSAILRYAEFVRERVPADEQFFAFFMNYFKGMTRQPPDEFEVLDDDMRILRPIDELRTLRTVLEDHVARVNPE